MRWPGFLVTGFALSAGFSGGFLFPKFAPQNDPVGIERVAGAAPVERTAGSTMIGATRQSLSMPEATPLITEGSEKPAMVPLAKLTAQQIAKQIGRASCRERV